MQDRPSYDELLGAIEGFLDNEIVPNVPGSRGFHARVAANAIRTIRRELKSQEDDLREEWAGLDTLLGPEPLPDTLAGVRDGLRARTEALCARIQTGDSIESVRQHVRVTVENKLRVTNPDLLLRR